MNELAVNWESTYNELVGAANSIKAIEDEGTNALVADLGATINQTIKDMEAAQAEEVAPHQAKIDAIKDRYKAWIPKLRQTVNHLRDLVVSYKRSLEMKRLEALKAEEEARKKAEIAEKRGEAPPPQIRAAVPPPAPNVSRGAFGKATVKKVWTVDLIDLKLLARAVADGRIPENVLAIQKANLTALGRGGMTFDPAKDGVKVYQKETTSFG